MVMERRVPFLAQLFRRAFITHALLFAMNWGDEKKKIVVEYAMKTKIYFRLEFLKGGSSPIVDKLTY